MAKALVGLVRDDIESRTQWGLDGAIYSSFANLVNKHADPWAGDKAAVKSLVKRASSAGGSEDAANQGTVFHDLTQLIDEGKAPQIPPALAAWAAAYVEAMAEWETLYAEPFLVCDQIQCAGSADRILRHHTTGQIVVGDIKTGTHEPNYPLKVSIQVAIYAHSVLYNQATGERTPIEMSHTEGLLIHVPIRDGAPRCDLYPLDLELGWKYAQLAAEVRAARKMPKLKKL